MRQEVLDDEGQVVEGEVGTLAQRADHRALLGGGLPRQAVRLGGAIQAVSNPSLAPLADGLGANTVALSQQARRLRGAGDLRADRGCSAGIRVDLVHGSSLSQDSAWQTLKPTPVLYDGQPNRIPTMFRDQTVRQQTSRVCFDRHQLMVGQFLNGVDKALLTTAEAFLQLMEKVVAVRL
jgi:hypothetical protein